MDNEFNKVRAKKESSRRVQASGDPFGLGPSSHISPKPVTKPASKPTIRPTPKPVVDPAPKLAETKSIKPAAAPASSSKVSSQKSQRARLKITKKTGIIIASALVIAVAAVLAVVLLNRSNEPEKSASVEPSDAPIAVEEKYPKETATALDIAISEAEIQLTERGHYRLSGETTNPVVVNAPGEVVIYLNGASIAPTGIAAISNLSEYPLTLILEDNTTSNLQTNSPDVNAIHSEGDLIIKGGGILNVAGFDVKPGREYREEAKINNLKVVL